MKLATSRGRLLPNKEVNYHEVNDHEDNDHEVNYQTRKTTTSQ